MKTPLALLALALSAGFALAHGGVEIGPHGGRVLEFSKNETLHGEVTLAGDKFQVALLDKDQKPTALPAATLTATSGTGAKPTKLAVEKTPAGFAFPAVAAGQTVVLQFRDSATGKPVTARFKFDPSNCEACNHPEWLCQCAAAAPKKAP